MKSLLAPWVAQGGILCLHGERNITTVIQEKFGKAWSFKGDFYRRTTHELNTSCTAAMAPATKPGVRAQLLPLAKDYCVKACMLTGVAPADRLYIPTDDGAYAMSFVPGFGVPIDEDMCAFAVSSYGEGKIAFFGDVNGEDKTVAALITLCCHNYRK